MSPNEKLGADDKLDIEDAEQEKKPAAGESKKQPEKKKGAPAKKEAEEEEEEEDLDEKNEDLAEIEEEKKAPPKPAPKKVITSGNLTKPIHLKNIKDQKLKALLEDNGPGHHRCVGFLNQNDILFPVGFKTRHFLIGWKGNVVVNKCPKCGHRNPAEEAIKGRCSNEKVRGTEEPCDFDAVMELEEFDETDLKKFA